MTEQFISQNETLDFPLVSFRLVSSGKLHHPPQPTLAPTSAVAQLPDTPTPTPTATLTPIPSSPTATTTPEPMATSTATPSPSPTPTIVESDGRIMTPDGATSPPGGCFWLSQ